MRLAVAAVAVVIAAFFGARLHDHDRCADARNAVFRATLGLEAAPGDAIDRIRESCRGTTAMTSVVAALRAQRRSAEAVALAREATRSEPDNPGAWRALAETAQSPAEARAAERRFSELDPRGARSLNLSAGRSTR